MLSENSGRVKALSFKYNRKSSKKDEQLSLFFSSNTLTQNYANPFKCLIDYSEIKSRHLGRASGIFLAYSEFDMILEFYKTFQESLAVIPVAS